MALRITCNYSFEPKNTEYVDNDVDVDDVVDDEEGAGAYFLLVRHSDGHTNCELH